MPTELGFNNYFYIALGAGAKEKNDDGVSRSFSGG
jgi:hypothetical protein